MAGAKKKKAQPRSSPKYAAAELRKRLNAELEGAEAAARQVLECVNGLRHGQLEHLATIPTARTNCRTIDKALQRAAKDATT